MDGSHIETQIETLRLVARHAATLNGPQWRDVLDFLPFDLRKQIIDKIVVIAARENGDKLQPDRA